MSTVEVNTWKKVARMELEDIIGFQITVYCYLSSIKLTPAKMKLLTILGMRGEMELATFCKLLSRQDIYSMESGARNAIEELEDIGLIEKEPMDGKKKLVRVSSAVGICNKLPVMVDVKTIAQ